MPVQEVVIPNIPKEITRKEICGLCGWINANGVANYKRLYARVLTKEYITDELNMELDDFRRTRLFDAKTTNLIIKHLQELEYLPQPKTLETIIP